jgi:hypothetical protein
MARKKTEKTTLKIHADPLKIRRSWAINPKTRVRPSTRQDRLAQEREREAREGG